MRIPEKLYCGASGCTGHYAGAIGVTCHNFGKCEASTGRKNTNLTAEGVFTETDADRKQVNFAVNTRGFKHK